MGATDMRNDDVRRRDNAYVFYVAMVVHRVLARHHPYERCEECPSMARILGEGH